MDGILLLVGEVGEGRWEGAKGSEGERSEGERSEGERSDVVRIISPNEPKKRGVK